jgi:tetratricopeptide (TPR) repeat protein
LRGAAPPPPIATHAESLTPLLHFGWSDLRAIRDGRWKYIEAPRPELYDLKDDPRETRNLVAQEASRTEALRGALASRLAAERATARTPSSSAAIPPELLEQLGALGYVGGGGSAAGEAPGADPKDKLEDYKVVSGLMREGLTQLHAKDYGGAAGRFRALLARGIRSFEVHYYLARALSSQKRPKDAVAHYEAAIERLPAYGAAYVGLSECHLALGDPRTALEVLHRGQAKAPRDARLYESEGRVLRALEKPREAIAAYERARSLAPKDALVRVKLGEMYRDAREPERAAAVMREAIALDPEPAEYWNALGMVLGGNDHLAEGEGAFREAVKREPTEAQYAYNLGLILVRQRRPDEAAPLFRKALELDPKFTPARDRLAELR